MTTAPGQMAQIRAGLVAALEAHLGEKVIVHPHQRGAVFPPAIELAIGTSTFHETAGGGEDDEGAALTFRVRVYASMIDNDAGVAELERYLEPTGPYSIKQAIESADPELGGCCSDVEVLGHNGEQWYGNAEEGGVLIGSEFAVAVIA